MFSFVSDGRTVQTAFWFSSELAKHYSDEPGYGKQLGGFEYKEDIQGFRSLWRKPISENESIWKSKLAIFGSKKFRANLTKYNPVNLKYMSFGEFWTSIRIKKMRHDQSFREDRLSILGCDLAAAHFTVYRGGAVKFCHLSNWVRDDKNKKRDYDDDLPNSYHPDYVVEAIDFSGTEIIYEGLKNIENLKMLKWLSFACCNFYDDWCLDRISGEFGETLEYLDISYTGVTHHGLTALYRFKNLKTLKVYGYSEYLEFWLFCQELKKAFPNMIIEGISDEMPKMPEMLVEETSEELKTASIDKV